jgi:hypothetical protein
VFQQFACPIEHFIFTYQRPIQIDEQIFACSIQGASAFDSAIGRVCDALPSLMRDFMLGASVGAK